MGEVLDQIGQYLLNIDWPEAAGLVFGLLAVFYLIKKNILTWPLGIIYVILSLLIFWEQRLYGDLLLHIFFLVLNIYGWFYWVNGNKNDKSDVPITWLSGRMNLLYLAISVVGIVGFGLFLENVHNIFKNLEPAALPYWDASTTALSVMGMWLTARKRIENWVYWFAVDVLAAGIYFYKGIYFYSLLYFVYIGLAVVGFLEWKKLAKKTS